MTRVALNNILWTLSLILQTGLLARLLRRGPAGRVAARRIPTFTALLVFYILRSLSLYVLSSRMTPPAYARTLGLLAILDLFLQLALAIEIELRLFPIEELSNVGKTLRGFAILLAIPAVAFFAAVLLSAALPARAPAPTDLLQLYDALFFLLLGFVVSGRIASRYVLRLTLGLAAYGAVCVASIIGRTFAATHRDTQSYLFWTYAASIAWLVIVAVWLAVLTAGDTREQVIPLI